MKRIKVFADLLTVIMIILLLVMFLEFLATTDIYHDYISKNVVERYAPQTVGAYPPWSDTPSEWKMANFSYGSRIILIITSLILSVSISRKIREEEPEA